MTQGWLIAHLSKEVIEPDGERRCWIVRNLIDEITEIALSRGEKPRRFPRISDRTFARPAKTGNTGRRIIRKALAAAIPRLDVQITCRAVTVLGGETACG